MAICYHIRYRDRFGEHLGIKWGEKPLDALEALKKGHGSGAEYSDPVAVNPQPFSEESRKHLAAFWKIHGRADLSFFAPTACGQIAGKPNG